MQPAGTAQVSINGNRVDCDYGTIDEWYVNGPCGLAQGFDELVNCAEKLDNVSRRGQQQSSIRVNPGTPDKALRSNVLRKAFFVRSCRQPYCRRFCRSPIVQTAAIAAWQSKTLL
jgi:hypothetical protein